MNLHKKKEPTVLRTNRLSDEKGVAMVELALSIPLLFFMVFGALEYSRSFKQMQISATLSREAASVAYRNCGGDEEGPRIQGCIFDVQTRMTAYAKSLVPDSQVIISIYNRDTSASAPKRLHMSPINAVPYKGTVSFASKFSAGSSKIIGVPDDNAINDHKRVVIAEAFVPFDAIIPGFSTIFNGLTDNFYDATIL